MVTNYTIEIIHCCRQVTRHTVVQLLKQYNYGLRLTCSLIYGVYTDRNGGGGGLRSRKKCVCVFFAFVENDSYQSLETRVSQQSLGQVFYAVVPKSVVRQV